jgi:hypothetical protein
MSLCRLIDPAGGGGGPARDPPRAVLAHPRAQGPVGRQGVPPAGEDTTRNVSFYKSSVLLIVVPAKQFASYSAACHCSDLSHAHAPFPYMYTYQDGGLMLPPERGALSQRLLDQLREDRGGRAVEYYEGPQGESLALNYLCMYPS